MVIGCLRVLVEGVWNKCVGSFGGTDWGRAWVWRSVTPSVCFLYWIYWICVFSALYALRLAPLRARLGLTTENSRKGASGVNICTFEWALSILAWG